MESWRGPVNTPFFFPSVTGIEHELVQAQQFSLRSSLLPYVPDSAVCHREGLASSAAGLGTG